MILISNLILEVFDGSTIASTEIYGTTQAPKQTYINIGSGNVFKLSWQTPTLANDDAVDHYNLIIKRHDTAINAYYDIFDKNIGLVNEFYVDSPLLPTVPEQYMLSIYLVAYGKHGSVTTSNVVNPYVIMGGGSYVKVEEGYAQPIMKRALAFTKGLPLLADFEGNALTDSEGNTLALVDFTNEYALTDQRGVPLFDNNYEPIVAVATKVLPAINDWVVVQDVYTKHSDGTWQATDIKFEVLTNDENNEGIFDIITDINGEPIYVL